jgi:hypothetical protein
MKLFCLLLALLLVHGSAVNDVAVGQNVDWKSDLEFLVKTLTDRHPDPFRKIAEVEFSTKVGELSDRIDSLESMEATFELMKLVASLGDGHTAVVPNHESFNFFPINVRWFSDGIHVRAIDQKYKSLIGAKLVAVGDVPAKKIVEKLGEILAHDNEWGIRKLIDKQFQTAEFLEYAGALDDNGNAVFQFEKDGKEMFVKLDSINSINGSKVRFVNPYGAGLMKPSIFLSLLMKDERGMPFWNEWIKDHKTIYFKYNQCRSPSEFKKLVDGTAGFIAQNDVQKFVLDLRDNSGGSSLVFQPLLEYLLSNKELNQKGKLFVIVGRDTFSSGIFAACDMRKTNALFVGEPTSGSPNHFGEVKTFKLPSSGLIVQHSTKTFRLQEDDTPAFEPDILIEFTADEVFAARDQALQAIFDYEAE